jgi:hypothetical protein
VIVLVGAGLALNPPSEADITNESKAEMFNFMAKTYVNQKDLKVDLDEIRDEFKEAMSHPHMEFDSIAKKLKQLDGAVSQLYTEEQTTSSSEWDIMLDADFNTSTGYYEVERGELINLSAELPSNAQTKVEIEGPFNYDREWTTSVASSGKLNSFFQMENTATLGVYELTIKQNNKSDSIEFEIIS